MTVRSCSVRPACATSSIGTDELLLRPAIAQSAVECAVLKAANAIHAVAIRMMATMARRTAQTLAAMERMARKTLSGNMWLIYRAMKVLGARRVAVD